MFAAFANYGRSRHRERLVSPLVLKNFSGFPEITPDARSLKEQAIKLSIPVTKVETDGELSLAVNALQALKAISKGMEATRKAVKAPVLELGKKIDSVAADFLTDSDLEEMRLTGLINHFQRDQLRLKREEEQRVERDRLEAERVEAEAKRLRESGTPDLKLEEKALDLQMTSELSAAPLTIVKPKGLVVKNRLNFEITDAIIFCQAYPQFFVWHKETETLKLRRREILEEVNREDQKGIFHVSQFPEELPPAGSRIANPPGIRIFEEVKSHVR